MELPKSKLIKSQKKTLEYRVGRDGKEKCRVFLRYDDDCGNGHNSFSITGETRELWNGSWQEGSGGCIHETIAKYFPELEKFIKWHLVSSDEPMHYIVNTVYHASNRDHNGLLKGETRQLKDRHTGIPAWELVQLGDKAEKYVDSLTEPKAPIFKYVPWCIIGEGKERDFEAARSCAVWPDASEEELSVSPERLTLKLQERLPKLMQEFKAAMEELGFTF